LVVVDLLDLVVEQWAEKEVIQASWPVEQLTHQQVEGNLEDPLHQVVETDNLADQVVEQVFQEVDLLAQEIPHP
tara:strand:- start:347 stop:568 length:222 start_codon:yes stop_codon:yes gene_type:complete